MPFQFISREQIVILMLAYHISNRHRVILMKLGRINIRTTNAVTMFIAYNLSSIEKSSDHTRTNEYKFFTSTLLSLEKLSDNFIFKSISSCCCPLVNSAARPHLQLRSRLD